MTMTATSRELRPKNRLAKAGSRRLVLGASTVLAALLVGAWLFVVQPADHNRHDEATPSATFLATPLGAPRASAPLVRTPARSVSVELGRHATTVRRDGHGLTLAAVGAGDAAWTRHAHGTSRPTPFGRETITVGPSSTEEFLTVDRHLGPRTWSWKLGSTTLKPNLRSDGSIEFRTGARLAGLRIRPVSILDAAGQDITPGGTRWTLARSVGGWRLQLRLDDSSLPTPYVIDPATDYPSPLYISSAAAGGTVLTNGWNLVTSSQTGANQTTTAQIARNTTGYVQWQPAVNPNATAAVATLPAAPNGRGWIVSTAGGTGFASGQWNFNVETRSVSGTVGEAALVAVRMWKVVLNGTGGITSSTLITGMGDDPGAQNVHPADTTAHQWTVSFPTVGAFNLGSTERLYVEFWRKQTTAITSNTASDRQIVFYAADGANTQITHPAADDVAPTHALSLTPVTGGSYYKTSNTTIYYKGNAVGSFTLSDTLFDAGSGGKDVTYPAVGTTGWTYAGQTVSTGPAFTSSAWSWSASPTNPTSKTINATDQALNAATGLVVSFATDITAPTTPSLALSGGPYYTTASVPLTPTDGTDGSSGVNTASRIYQRDEVALANNACATPFPGTWANVTLTAGADTTVVSGKCYRYRYTVADNVGNTSAASVASGTAMVDTSAPVAPTFTITAGAATSTDGTTTVWYRPGAPSGSFSVTASSSDPQTGISSYTFPTLTGWTRSLAGATATYSHTGSPSDPTEPNNVTATNNASNTSTTSFTVTPDANAPTGMSASITAGYFTTASVRVTLANGSDGAGESGINTTSGVVERDEIALSGGSCGVFAGTWTTVTLNGSSDDTTVLSGKCYRYRYKISDKVGNQGTQSGTSGTAKVDTDGPGAPTFAFSGLSNAYDNGSGTVFFRGGAAGGLTVTPTATDAQSGVASYVYPTLGSGWSNTGGAYTFTAAAVDPTEPNNVHGVNGAGTNGTDASFTITRDSNAPTGMSASITGGYYTSASIRVTLANGTDGGGESGVDSTSGIVERDVANLGADACAAFPDSWSTVTLNGSGDDTSVLSGKCYRYRYKISDRVGNQGTQSGTSATAKVDTTGPAAPTFAFSSFTRASSTGTTVYFKTGAAGGFTVTPSATDAETGVSSYAYPPLGSGWSNTAGAYTFTAAAVDPTEPNNAHGVNAAGLSGTDASFTVTADGNAPSGMSASVTAGYVTTTSVRVTLANGSDGGGESGLDATTGVVERDEAPLLAGACDPFPGTWTSVTLNGSSDDTTVLSGKCYRYRYKISDKVGNQGTQAGTSGTVKVDTSKPTTPSLGFSALTNAYDNGSGTVFFRSGVAGGFTVSATSSDPESGVASTTFPGLAAGWSQTAGVYTFTAAAADPAEPNDVFTTNGAGLDSLHQSFTVTADGNAPTGMSAAVAAGYVTTTSVNVTLANGSDGAGESGVNAASGIVERDEAPLVGGTCDPFPGSWTAVTLNGSGDDTTVQTAKCYRYRYKISDRVGNQGTQAGTSGTVKVDTTAPSAPSLAYSGFTRAWENGSGTVYFKGGAAGGFTVTPSATDAQSGVSSYAYPALGSGWSNTGGAYTFNSASDPVEPNNVHAVNGAGTSGADTSFTVTLDSSAPTGMSATVSGGFSSSTTIAVTLANGSDTGAGVDATTGVVERDEAPLVGGTCDPFPGSWATVTLSGGNDTAPTGKCYRYRYSISDRVDNQGISGASATVKVDTTKPSAPSLTFAGLTNAYDNGSGTVFFRAGAAGGVTVNASSTDTESGIASTTFPALGTGWSESGGAYTFAAGASDPAEPNNVHTTNGAGLDSNATSFTVTADSSAPTTTAQCGGAACSAGWYTSSPVSVTLWASDGAGAGVQAIHYTTDGSDPTALSSTYAAPLSIGSTTTVKFRAWDRVGNVEAVGTVVVQIDSTPPSAPSLTLSESSPKSFVSGSTLFYNPSGGNAASFTVDGTSSDGESPLDKLTFPALGGMTGGGDDSSSPYSATYDWTASSTATGAQTVTARNAAGLTAGTAFTVTPDTAAPTGMSATVSGGFSSSTTVAFTLANGSDSGAGVDASSGIVERDEAPLLAGACDPFPGTWTPVTLSGGNDSVATGKCYRYRYSISDRVGNQGVSGASATVKVDATAPSAPSLGFSALTAAYDNGSGTVYYRPSAAAGSFTVAGASTDAQSGVSGYSFPAAASGWTRNLSGATATYAHTGSPAEPGTGQNVHATNAAGVDSADTAFAVTADASAPTGMSATTAGGYATSASIHVTLANGSDSGSGLAAGSGLIERDETGLAGDSCSPFPGSWAPVTLNGSGDDTGVVSGKCYRYRYKISDRVGNQGTSGVSASVKVDTDGPSAPALSFGSFTAASGTGSTVYFRPGTSGGFTASATSTDSETGVASTTFPALGSGWTRTGGAYSFDGTAGDPAEPNNVHTTNGAGLDSAATAFTVTADAAAPTTTPQCNGGSCAPWFTSSPVSVSLSADDGAGSGVEAIRFTTDGSDPTALSSTYAAPLSIGSTTTVKFRAWDNVGNVEAVGSIDVRVDTSAPSSPSLTLTERPSSPYQHVSGTTLFYNPSASNAGGFRVDGTSSDAQSGIQKLTFPALGGMTGGGDATSSPYRGDYDWTASSTATGAQTVTARNAAGLTAAATFDVTADTAAPTGQTLALDAGPWFTSTSVALTSGDGGDAAGSGVDASSRLLEREEAGLTNGACGSFGGTWTQVVSLDTTVVSGKCYRYRFSVTDSVGNRSTPVVAAVVAKVDTSAPSAPSLAFSGFTNASATGSTVYFRPGAAGGFTVAPSSADAQSGVASYAYPALGSGWSRSGGDYSFTSSATEPGSGQNVHATNGAGTDSADTPFTATADSTAPATSIACDGAACSNGWVTSFPVSVTLSATDGGSGVDRIVYSTDGSDPTSGGTTYTGAFDVNSTTTVKYAAYDKVGNVESVGSTQIRIDSTPPTAPSLNLTAGTSSSVTGSTLFFRSGAAGGFTVAASSTDGESGVAGYTFPALGTGWTHTAGAYNFDSSAGDPSEPNGVTAQNTAGLDSAPTSFTVTADSSAPATSAQCDGAACSSGFYTATPVAVTLVADDGSGAGVDKIRYTTDGSDPTGSSTAYAGAISVASTTTIRFRAWDNVGNAEAVETLLVKIDASVPDAPALTLSESSPSSFVSGTTLFYNPSGSNSSSFAVDATSGDAESGIDGIAFPALTGMTGGGDDTSSPYSATYDWTASSTATGAHSVTARNAAALTASSSFTVTPDTAAPTGMSATTTGGFTSSTTVAVALDNGTDAAAGIDAASGVVERDAAPLSAGACDPFPGTWTGASLSGGNDTVATGKCYRYRYKISDRVGNQGVSSASATVKVDATGPSAPNLSFSALSATYATGSGTVYYRPGAAAGSFTVTASSTDAQSGVSGYSFPAAGSGWTRTLAGDGAAYAHTGSPTEPGSGQNVHATNAAGVDSADNAYAVVADSSAPTGMSASVGGGFASSTTVAVTLANGSDTGSGVDATTGIVERDAAPLSGGTCDPFPGTWTTVSLSGGNDTVATGSCYRYRYKISDRVGNQAVSGASASVKVDSTNPSTPALSFSALTNAHDNGSGTVFFRPGAAGGFTVSSSSADAQSGVVSTAFPALGTGWSETGGVYSFTGAAVDPGEPNNVHSTNGAGLDSDPASFTVTADASAPTTSAQCDAGACSAGWYTAAPVSVILSAADGSGSGVDTVRYTTDGSDPTPFSSAYAGALSIGSTTTVKFRSWDNVGNVEAVASLVVRIDTTAPSAPGLTLSESSPSSFVSGSTLFYNPSGSNSGSFGVAATTGDAESGIDQVAFPALGGMTGGGAQTSGPFSESYAWNASSTATGAHAVTATNNAGLTASTSFTVTADTTAPAGGSVSYADGWNTSGSVTITTADGSDGGSGVDASTGVLERQFAAVSAGSCDPFAGSWTQVSSPDSVSNGCYRYRYRLSDKVGNERIYTSAAVVQVDTTAPSAPSLAFSGFSNSSAIGSTVWFRPGAAGGFTLTPSSSDAQSGISSNSYPALGSGWSRSGGDYTFTGSASEPGAGQNVHATNGAGTDSADTAFTVSADSTAPSSSIDCDGGACAGWHTGSPVSVTLGATDAQSGLDRIVYTTDGSDPTSGGTTYSGPFGVAATSTVKYAAYDKVGNVESVHSTTIQIDTTPPSAPTLGFAGFTAASSTGSTVYYRPGAGAGSFDVTASSADAQSGVASYAFPAASAGWTRTLAGATATYAHTGSPTEPGSGQNVTAQNGAGLNSSASTFTVSADSTAPATTIACAGAACSAGWYTSAPVSLTLAASDEASGVDRIVYTTDGSDPTSGGTTYAGAFSVSSTTTVKYAAYDNVGNVESVKSRTIQIDTTAPSAPTFAFSGFANAQATGSTVYFRSGSSGGFTLTPSSSDAQSGVASYAFPNLGAGWTRSGGDYSFDATAGDPAEPNDVTATNNAGLTSGGASFSVTADSSAPASAMQCDGSPCGNGWATSSPVSITLSAADGGAGVKEIRYTTDGSDPLAGGTVYSGAFDVLGSTTVKFAAVDEVGNAESVQSKLIRIDTTPPSAPTLGFSALTNASVSGSTVYFRGGAAGGFTVTGSATDAQSGVASYSFPTLGSGWSGSVSGADDAYSFTAAAADPSEPNDVLATNAAGEDSNPTSFTVTRDDTAPATSVQCGGGACSAGWYTSSPVSVTLSATDGDSGVDRIVYTTDGSDPTAGGTTYSGALSVATTTTVRYTAYDKVGNVESVNAQQVRIDTTAPATSAGIASPTGSVHVNGSAVFYRPGGSGGFDLTATVTDAQSGAQKASFPSIGGFGSGGDVAAPGPYSSSYSYTGTPGQPGTVGVTGHNNAGLTSTDNVTVTADSTAPSSSIACNGSPCASGWTTSAPVSIALSATDGGSGLDHIAYSTDGSDPTSGGTTYAAPFAVSASTTVKWAAFDNVGNVESVHSETIQIDTTAPSAPTLSVSAVTNAVLSGTTVFFRPGIAGGFNVTATSTDGESGVASYAFPALGAGWSASGTGASRAYSFGAAAVDPAEPNDVTATNTAGQASAPTSFTVTADSTAPSGGGVSYVDGFRSSASVALTLDDGSDTGAGLETTNEVLERSIGTLANGECTGFGSFNTLAIDPSLAYTDLTVTSGNCYAYRYLVQDRVGNLRTYTTSAVAKIDTDLPAATQGNPGLYMHATVTLTGTATDTGGSDIAALTFQYSDDNGATWKPIGTDTSSPYSVGFDTTTAATPDGAYDLRTVATDNAGNSSASPVVAGRQIDNTAPNASIDSPAAYVRGVVTLSATTSDSGSGISTTSYQFSDDGGATWTTTPASWNTALSSDGLYRVRVVATDNAGNQATDASGTFRVDNTPPTAVLADPGANLRGTVDLASTASDSGSGVDTVTYEHSAAGAGTWTSMPASWNTTSVSDGLYDLRVVVVDRAGNRTNSAPRAGIRVDNTPPNVTLNNPISNSDVAATVTLASTADDTGSGLAGPVTYEYRTASPAGAWTATPAAWNTTLLPDGGYDVRATAVDRAGNTKQSNVAANVRVDNTPPAISLTTPADASYVNAAAADPFALGATATDAGSGIKQVEFFQCSDTSVSCATGSWNSVGIDAAPGPYSASWPTPADGHRALRAVATDNADRTTVALADVTVDRTLPDTTIVTKPGDPSNEASPTFTFSSNETGATFTCSLDGAPFAVCTSPIVLPALADGTHGFAVRATDLAGNTDASDATWSWLTDLTPPTATMDNPGLNVRGTVALTSSQADPGGANASGVASVNYEFSSDEGASWAPTPAAWDTAPITDGLYKLRVVVLDNAGNQTIDQLGADVRVDNTAPSSSQDDPGAYLRSGITLTGSAADPDDPAGRPGSGVTQVRFEVSPSGADTWTTVGSAAGAPYSTSLDTTTLADGRYDFRTVATDAAGNEAPGGAVTSRLVDNTVPTASVGDPGANLRGTVTLGSTTADPGANASGIASVDYEVSSGGGWTSVPDTWSTSSMPDGLYDIRVTATDRAGNSTTSSPIGGRRVDNTPPSTTDNAPADYQSSDVTVSLSASDAGSGVSVTEYSVDGGGFQAGSSVTIGAPSDGSNDGTHTISYFSADVAGNIESPKTTSVSIDATPPVCPTCGADDYLSGTETLTASPGATLSGIKSVTFEYAAAGAPRTSPPPGTWSQIAKDTTAPYSAAWATNDVADGEYDLRVIVESKSGVSSTTYLDSKVVDNTAPSAGVGAPAAGSLVSGSVTFAATAGDANPIASVEFFVGGSSIATRSTPPFSTNWDTTSGSDGSRSLYVVVTDIAGNSTTSATRSVTVDNDAPRPTLSSPGAGISGSATLTASSDSDTVRVDIQRSPAGANRWTTIGSPTSSPFSVTFDSTFLVDGTYDLRAVATDQSGHVGISGVVTTRIDNTAPSASLTRPSAGATVGGPAVPLEAAASDPTSGVASVRFQYRLTGGGGFSDIADDTTAPYVATWDATTLGTGSYDLRVVATDVAGNVKESTPVTVSVDSTAPIVVLNDPGATLSGTVTLTATTSGSPATRVTFERSPAGASAWTAIATDTSTPWSASFDTTSVDDGMYDLRAVAADAYGNERTSIRSGIRIDNGVPSVISSTPADGSTIASATSISLVASEALAAIDGATLDGAGVVAPILSGAQATFPTGTLGPGPHTLAGTLRDRAGKTRAFEIHFTVWVASTGGGGGGGGGGGESPYVERNAPADSSTTVTAPGGGATATMPPGAWSPRGADWLVLRIEMNPAPAGVGGPVTFESAVAEVTTRWALTGIEQHTFLQPIAIAIPSSGTNVAGATYDGGSWRVMREVPSPGALPTGWSDGYWVDGSGVHILTLHLSEFTVVRSLTTPPAADGSGSGSGSGTGSDGGAETGETTTITTRPTTTTTTTSTPRPQTRLGFQVVNTKVFQPGRQVRIGARVKATRAATGTVALRNPTGGQVATWALSVKAGTNVLTLKMPRTLRAPGRYTLAWTLVAAGNSVVRLTKLTIPGESSDPASEWSIADAKPQRPDVVVAAEGFSVGALALPRSVRALVATKSRDAFDLSGDERTNVLVVVLDVDRLGIEFLHDLDTVFPTLRIVAIANDPELRRRSLGAGADIAFPHAAGPARVGAAVRRLAGE